MACYFSKSTFYFTKILIHINKILKAPASGRQYTYTQNLQQYEKHRLLQSIKDNKMYISSKKIKFEILIYMFETKT